MPEWTMTHSAHVDNIVRMMSSLQVQWEATMRLLVKRRLRVESYAALHGKDDLLRQRIQNMDGKIQDALKVLHALGQAQEWAKMQQKSAEVTYMELTIPNHREHALYVRSDVSHGPWFRLSEDKKRVRIISMRIFDRFDQALRTHHIEEVIG